MKSSLDRVRSAYSARTSSEGRKGGTEPPLLGKGKPGSARPARPRHQVLKPKAQASPEAGKENPRVASKERTREENVALKEALDELERTKGELHELRKAQNDAKCQQWLQGASGRSTVLAFPGTSSKDEASVSSEGRLRDQLCEKDRTICELRSQIGAMRLKKEEHLKGEVEARVARRMKEVEGRNAVSLSRQVKEIESNSKSTVSSLTRSLKSFVAAKVEEGLKVSIAACEQRLGPKLEERSEQIRTLAARQGALSASVRLKLEDHEGDLGKMAQACSELRDRNQFMEEALKREREENAGLSLKLSAEHDQFRSRQKKLKEFQEEADRSRSELADVKAQASSRASEFLESNKILRQSLTEKDEALEAKQMLVCRLETELRDARSLDAIHKEEACGRVSQLTKEMEELTAKLADQERAYTECCAKNKSLAARIQALQEEVRVQKGKSLICMDEARLEIERQNEKAMEMETEISSLRASLASRSKSEAAMGGQRMKHEHDEVALRNAKLESEVDRLQTAWDAEKKSLRDAKKLVDLLKSQSDEAMKECKDIAEENLELKSQLNSVKEQSKKKVRQAATKLQECKKLLETLQEEKRTADRRDCRNRGDLQDSRGKVRKLEGALKSSNEKSKKLALDLEKVHKEHEELKSKFQDSRSEQEKENKSSLEQVVALQSELIQATRDVLSLKEESEKKDERMVSMAQDLKKRAVGVDTLSKEVEALKREKTEFRAKYSLLRSKLSKEHAAANDPGDRPSRSTPVTTATKDHEDFERVLGRLKRINANNKLRLGSTIRDVESKRGADGSLVALIYRTIKALDRKGADLPDCAVTWSSFRSAFGVDPEPEIEQPKTPEMDLDNELCTPQGQRSKLFVLR
ncbi:hypothetical protein A3770_02p14740 [Chloropicon primus]|uniref:Uncharacterized protein n=1 Tax=Chloropicon primus TaxID=1764295 RepID=A0A5B8MEC6_9CHLO|nr:hypothetical protein A3770_02p14740 [Chloropicon primus]|eukprot:QDZ18956.1 hypothetical protein A3770_02p14740 [Chloropicon primus]